ncbi:CpsD/CapB family tyrosine-protein kinase [Neobacillus cucumis]|uniref:CpsD/CapB family tyrosine-protein kinase n=1 Tax=Neobacillus cucumis TaxID=1740721 RepID=UPI0021555725|nr:CpsD/CapB family tyrosine-protein kinase [Neobacillus cucumis]
MALLNRKSLQLKKKINLITATNQNCKISEQYRTIRTNFLSSLNCINSRTIIITSPGHDEGKSTTAVNFAISLAQQGKKVLLIDADLRNPILHYSFKMENSIGLSNVLSGNLLLEDSIYRSGIRDLDLLTSGPIPFNPAELLGSEVMGKLIETVSGQYDVVLFDTPPVLEVSDAKIIANQCDGVILVVRYGKTKNEQAIEVKKFLESSKANLLGTIINNK